jgi:hypothetical protein
VIPIPLRIVDGFIPETEPGMMWRYPPGDTQDRECWWIVLPNTKPAGPGYASEIAWLTTDKASKPPHEMWEVSGTPPSITVSPSIDVECWIVRDGLTVREGSYWHGWIRNGMIVDA